MQNDTTFKQPSRSPISADDEINALQPEVSANACAKADKDKIIEILMNLVVTLKEEIQKLKDENVLLKEVDNSLVQKVERFSKTSGNRRFP